MEHERGHTLEKVGACLTALSAIVHCIGLPGLSPGQGEIARGRDGDASESAASGVSRSKASDASDLRDAAHMLRDMVMRAADPTWLAAACGIGRQPASKGAPPASTAGIKAADGILDMVCALGLLDGGHGSGPAGAAGSNPLDEAVGQLHYWAALCESCVLEGLDATGGAGEAPAVDTGRAREARTMAWRRQCRDTDGLDSARGVACHVLVEAVRSSEELAARERQAEVRQDGTGPGTAVGGAGMEASTRSPNYSMFGVRRNARRLAEALQLDTTHVLAAASSLSASLGLLQSLFSGPQRRGDESDAFSGRLASYPDLDSGAL